jgi:hypothetical protein
MDAWATWDEYMVKAKTDKKLKKKQKKPSEQQSSNQSARAQV